MIEIAVFRDGVKILKRSSALKTPRALIWHNHMIKSCAINMRWNFFLFQLLCWYFRSRKNSLKIFLHFGNWFSKLKKWTWRHWLWIGFHSNISYHTQEALRWLYNKCGSNGVKKMSRKIHISFTNHAIQRNIQSNKKHLSHSQSLLLSNKMKIK